MRPLAWTLAALVAAGCSARTNQMVIGIATDLTAPDQIDTIRFQTDGPRGIQTIEHAVRGMPGDSFGLPNTVVLYTDDDSAPTITADLLGLQSDQNVVSRRAIFPIGRGQPRFLRMALVNACRTVACPTALTCIDGLCSDPTLTADQLPLDQPKLERSVACDGPSNLIDTSAHAPLPPAGTGCLAGQFCLEGVCYQGDPPATYGFAETQTLMSPQSFSPYGAAIFAEVTGDGVPDLILGGGKLSGLQVLAGSADGTLKTPVELTPDPGDVAYHIVAADFDGDGKPDFAVATDAKGVAVLTAAKAYQQPATVPIAGSALRLVAADFDQDGKPDLVIGTALDLRFAHGNGDGTFAAPVLLLQSPGASVTSLAAADFNGDGAMDLAACDGGAVQAFLGDGIGRFDLSYSYGGPASAGVMVSVVAAADFDGDGRADLAMAAYHGPVIIARGDGKGHFTPGAGGQAQNWTTLAMGDLDGDGRIDLVAGVGQSTPQARGQITAFLNNGDGTLRESFSLFMASGPSMLAPQSFGGRLPDLVLAVGTNEIQFLTNRFGAH